MATGYTCRVADGTLTDFATFARLCAGVADDVPDVEPLNKYYEDRYYEEAIAAAQRRLEELRAMSADAKVVAAKESAAKMAAFFADNAAAQEVMRARYEAMQRQVEAWTPPSPDHEALRRGMLQQLQESIKWDCRPLAGAQERPPTTDEWWQMHIEAAERDVVNSKRRLADKIAERHKKHWWRRLFNESLESLTTAK